MSSQEPRPILKRSNPNFQDECKQIASDLASHKTTMLEVVMQLEPYFSSKEIDDREEGVHVLSTILELIPITSLWQEEIGQFCLFYKGRLNDHYKVIPALLNGILALSKYDKPMKNHGFSEILTTMFQTVSCQALQNAERLKIFHIFRNMLRNQTAELLDLGPDFVYGVIAAIDGERDPRNLIFLFEWLPEFINTVKLGHLVEEMFEIISSYFPVDFRVPAAEANGISRDALAEALKPCLCATNDFAEQSIELAIEKLDSDLQIAKHDSLQLLHFGCKKFTNDVYIKYKTGIWSALQKELLKFPSQELETLLLSTITEISRKISTDHTHFVDIFDKVLETNVGNINVIEKFFNPTCKLFLAMSKANAICANRILQNVQPRFINLFNITSTKEHKILILRILIEFIKVGDEYNANTSGIPQFLMTLLLQQDEELRALSLEAICYIQSEFEEIKLMLLEQWGKLLIEPINVQLQLKFHQCITHYATKCTQEIVLLIESLPNVNFQCLMENLSVLSSIEPFIGQFLKLQLNYFDVQPKICLKTLNTALKLHKNNEILYKSIDSSNIIESKLLCWQLYKNNENIDESDLLNVMDILMHIMGSYTVEQQSVVVEKHLLTALEQFQYDNTKVYFVSGLMTNLYLDNLCDYGILYKLFEMSCGGHLVAVQLLANLINKLPEDVISSVIERFENELMQQVENAYFGNVVVWVTKALFMRGHNDRKKWIQIFVQYLNHPDVLSKGMKIIMSDDCPPFSSSSHCRRRLLYKQDFFLEMCQLLDADDSINNEKCILAFGALAQEVPMVILKMNFEKFIRLIMLCLDNHKDATGPITIMESIQHLIETGDALSEQYLDDFIVRLVNQARFSVSMKVRMVALRCVRLYINEKIPMHKLIKHKAYVTQELGHCVGDKKRLVRKEAAEARLKWFLLGAPI